MSRFRMWFASAIGLLTLLILAVVLVGLFGRLAGPVVPSQAMTPTRLASAATATSLPYPPPSSPTPQPPPVGTPTVAPTPIPTFTPVPSPTPVPPPTPVTLPTGPLPPGLKIVCVDAADDGATSLIWVANVANLADKRQVAQIRNLAGRFWPYAWVSPDGRRVAYLLPSKYRGNSWLGVVNIDGTEHTVLDEKAFDQGPYSLRWSSDSRYIAYIHCEPGAKLDECRMELSMIEASGQGRRTLAGGLHPYLIGWAKDGHTLYYTIPDWSLWSVNVDETSSASVQVARLTGSGAYDMRLSPDGTRFLYSTRASREQWNQWLVNVVDVSDETQRNLIPSIASTDFADANYKPAPVWLPDSANVTYSQPMGRDHAELRTIGLHASSSTLLKETGGGYYEPLAWSPDGKFLAALWRGVAKTQGGEETFHLGLLSPDGRVQQVDSINSYFVAPRFHPLFAGWIEDQR